MVFFGIGIALGLLTFALARHVAPAVVTFLISSVLAYGMLPTLAWGYTGIVLLVVLATLVACAFSWVANEHAANKNHIPTIFLVVVGLFAILVPLVTTTAFGRADRYHGLLGSVDTLTNSTDLPPFDPTQVRVVDHDMALRLADKRLGEVTALGSQTSIGEMRLQAVKGDLFWVAPLNHSGFFKWFKNRSGTPGYLMVSATNPSDVRLITQLGGKDLALRYNDGAFFGDDVERYVYAQGYVSRGLTDLSFEVDDEGRPYYVVTRFDHRIGFGGEDANGVVVLDAQTGKVQEYAIEDAPAWVDRIQPESFVVAQINDWGEYPHGWWNPSDRDKLKATDGVALVYGNDGRSYFYTGITSYGADEGTVGYMLVDSRTKAARFFKQPGATEAAAMSAAASALPEKAYTAMFPVPGNVGGEWTYITPLKNAEGQIGAVALVNVTDYRIVGVGQDARSAARDYQRKLASRGGQMAMDQGAEKLTVRGKVVRQAADTREGNTDYYLQLEGQESRVFIGGSSVSAELPLTREGDVVSIQYDDTGAGVAFIKQFDNEGLAFSTTPAQAEVDEKADAVREAHEVEQAGQNADARWETLSDSAKAELVHQADTR